MVPDPSESHNVASPQGPEPHATSPQKRAALIAAAAGVVVLAVAGVVASRIVRKSDGARIARLVTNFTTAVDTHDQATTLSLLCKDEAAGLADNDDYPPGEDAGPSTTQHVKSAVKTSGIRIVGNVASARFKRPSNASGTLYFRREGGHWTVCAPAAGQLPAPARSQ